jgi:hypothetical protein
MTPPNDNARGRDVIDQILVNMRGQTEELRYSRIVASSYNVHLHPDDFARLEGLVPEIVAQARRALSEELERLNRARPLEERLRRWVNQPKLPVERAGSEWAIHVLADPNDELEPGDILVDATLVTPASEDFGGSRTQRIVTRRHGDEIDRHVGPSEPTPAAPAAPVTTASHAASISAAAASPNAAASLDGDADSSRDGRTVLATLRWRDVQGDHEFRMVTPTLKLGRGGQAYWVDVKLDTVPDVSREHLRIRFDEASRQFFIQDLSSFGTTVDGVALPSSAAGDTPGTAAEAPLPQRAVIGLAGALDILFEAGTGAGLAGGATPGAGATARVDS